MTPLALTIGEPAGIGPDIALQAWLRRDGDGVPPFYLIGDPGLLASRMARLDLAVPMREVAAGDVGCFGHALPVHSLGTAMTDTPGAPSPANAQGVISAIDRAVEDVHRGRAAAIVTAPIAKKPLYDAGFTFPGHTEYLAHLAQKSDDGADLMPVMMLAGPRLRAVPVTIHVPLSAVPGLLSLDLITRTARIVASDLTAKFGIARPRIAMSGLNPHAGEEGAMGREEIDMIAPAIAQLRQSGIDVAGPLPADTMFHEAARARYDAAICMYHDQALIAAKALDFDRTVNVTLGLPFIRTSPDHGTAFDIAGTGRSDPASLIAALKMARDMADRQAVSR